jgi:predicted porin
MKKNLIALAVAAAVVAPAIATADVTVYGVAQVEVTSVSNEVEILKPAGTDPITGSTNKYAKRVDGISVRDHSNSRLGVKADEDLGNDWKGLAKFEFKVDPASGTANSGLSEKCSNSDDFNSDGDCKDSFGGTAITAREMMVGVSGKGVGTFSLGRLKSPYKYAGGVKYDVFVATALQARGAGGMSAEPAVPDAKNNYHGVSAFGHGGFLSKTLGYNGKLGPVDLAVAYGAGQGDGLLAIAAKMKQKNWEAGVAIIDAGDRLGSGDDGTVTSNIHAVTGNTDLEYSATKLHGQYKMGMHTISAQYEMIEYTPGVGSCSTGDGCEPTYMFLGYQAKMGKNTFVVQYGMHDADGAKSCITKRCYKIWNGC